MWQNGGRRAKSKVQQVARSQDKKKEELSSIRRTVPSFFPLPAIHKSPMSYLEYAADRECLLQCKYAFDLLTHGYFAPSAWPDHVSDEQAQRYRLLCVATLTAGVRDLFRKTSCYLRVTHLQAELLLFLADYEKQLATFEQGVSAWRYPAEWPDDGAFVSAARRQLTQVLAFCNKRLERLANQPPLPLPSTPTDASPPMWQRYATIVGSAVRQRLPRLW
jgi:hypothetical protein